MICRHKNRGLVLDLKKGVGQPQHENASRLVLIVIGGVAVLKADFF
jgi:hypothetical protein